MWPVLPCRQHEPRTCLGTPERAHSKRLGGRGRSAGGCHPGRVRPGPLRLAHQPGHAVRAGRGGGFLYRLPWVPSLGLRVCRRHRVLNFFFVPPRWTFEVENAGEPDRAVHHAGGGPGDQPSGHGAAARDRGGSPERARARASCRNWRPGWSAAARPAEVLALGRQVRWTAPSPVHRVLALLTQDGELDAAARAGCDAAGRHAVLHARSGHAGAGHRPLARPGRLVPPAGRERAR